VSGLDLQAAAAASGLDAPGLRWAAVAVCALAVVPAGLRWLRVAQREHYIPDAASRFALRWWASGPANLVGLAIAAAAMVVSGRWAGTALVTGVVVAIGPLGLDLRGTSAPLAWTRRLRTLAGVWLVLQAAVVAVGAVLGVAAPVAAAGALAVPAFVDLACAVTAPFERRAARSHVERARARLARVVPTVVAITGSYGKTSTKGYVAHLVGAARAVVASPASFNNRAGLARAVNEHLAEGTDVFVAEMGTYGAGEIAELCEWLTPDVAVITAIGPVHLERFGSEERIVEAKAEILTKARVGVLVVDDPRLRALADRRVEAGLRTRRVSGAGAPGEGAPRADVRVANGPDGLCVWVDDVVVAEQAGVDGRAGNIACAIAVALELGVPAADIVSRLGTLPTAPHRLQPSTAPSGCLVLDDTYNANPAGARVALQALARVPGAGRRVLVTPGMVELGARQAAENERFAEAAADVVNDVVVVGRTNRRALRRGLAGRDVAVTVVDRRAEAVDWVRQHLGAGDAVLYENDLPDHYP